MPDSLNQVQSSPFVGLGTQTYTVPSAGNYTTQVRATIPYQAAGSSSDSSSTAGGSACQILVRLNGVTKLTLGSPSPSQESLSGSTNFACAANDTITVVVSSANAVDAVPNAVKGIINIYKGF
jgi:hypothetical protein